MPRPTSKSELVQQSRDNYHTLKAYVDSLSESQRKSQFPVDYLNRNVKDVFAHLYEWQLLFMEWYKLGMSGKTPKMPAQGYTWKTLPDLNSVIQQKYADWDYNEIVTLLSLSHTDILRIIEKHTDEELFEKKRYHWTGSTSLGAYLISVSASHYLWAFKLIKKALRGN